jgi:hypothetical protein
VGDGFTKLHEYGLNERLSLQQKLAMGEDGSWNIISKWLDDRQRYGSPRPLYGWTNGFPWCMDRMARTFRADFGKETVLLHAEGHEKGSHNRQFLELFATNGESLAKLFMFLEELDDALGDAHNLSTTLDFQIGRLVGAKNRIDERGEDFSKWHDSLSREQRADGLMQLLIDKYSEEHRAMMQTEYNIVLDSVCIVARMHGVRYMSITARDLIVLENIRTTRLPFGKPMAWHIADIMNIGGGCGNGPQSQISLHKYLPPQMCGTYLISPEPGRVGPPISLANYRPDHINMLYDGSVPLFQWLKACGADDKNTTW